MKYNGKCGATHYFIGPLESSMQETDDSHFLELREIKKKISLHTIV